MKDFIKVMKALSDPNRVKIVKMLQHKTMCVCELRSALQVAQPDEIYNLACPASPVHYQYNPVKTIKTSVSGTINMLGMAKRVIDGLADVTSSTEGGHQELVVRLDRDRLAVQDLFDKVIEDITVIAGQRGNEIVPMRAI